jgi:hypothetical protein
LNAFGTNLKVALSAIALDEFPRGKRIPFGPVRRRVIEGAVLNQLRVKTAICGIIEILEKNADEIGTDWFTSVGLDRYGGCLRVDQRGAGDPIGPASQ